MQTLEQFVEKAKTVHGDKYDYSQAVYTGARNKLTIICKIHGPFEQSAGSHLSGCGCRKCGRELARATMQDRYGVDYIMQSQTAVNKANAAKKAKFGSGKSPESGRKRFTQDEFIAKAREVHGDKYDYSRVVYQGSQKKVTIVCPKHGPFEQTANKHLQGRGCQHPECIAEKKISTSIERFGVANAMQSAEVRQKLIENNIERYGVPNTSLLPGVTAKRNATVQAKYGVDCTLQADGIKERVEATRVEKFGGNSPMCSAEVRAKASETMLAKYGVEHALQSDMFKQLASATCQENYGVDNPMQSDEVKQRVVITCQTRYGVDSVLQSSDVRCKIVDTCRCRFDASSPLGSDVIREKGVLTSRERYGVDNPMQSDEVKQRLVDTYQERYNEDNPMHVAEIKQRVTDTKRRNGTFNMSQAEDVLYVMLCEFFGQDDVVRQYRSSAYQDDAGYQFACDFYVKSRDLYIELNASWTHGGHWFDANCQDDIAERDEWLLRGSAYYKNAVSVWTGTDVRKRDAALRSGLNYIVFWDNQLRDAELWLASGAPDGHDYDEPYSWLPDRLFNPPACPKLTGTRQNLSQIVKAYQFHVFFARELALWQENKLVRGLPLHVFLYHNRLKYLDKTPFELSTSEILRGLTISGIMKGYTVFNTDLMHQVVSKYNIKSIYDPCAGWGERLLYCFKNNIEYTGVDINDALAPGYMQMLKDFGIRNQRVVFDDSSKYLPTSQHQAVLTCPPYGSIEHYSDIGAENFSELDFLAWWRAVISNAVRAKPEYFCFQINQKYRGAMSKLVEAAGFVLIDEFRFNKSQSSHFTRGKDGADYKKEFESMLVFRR